MPEPTVAEVRDADLQSVLDQELSRLPDRCRGVIVLCDLEGMTRREAARQAQATWEVSERRACQVMGQPRSTHRYKPREPEVKSLQMFIASDHKGMLANAAIRTR